MLLSASHPILAASVQSAVNNSEGTPIAPTSKTVPIPSTASKAPSSTSTTAGDIASGTFGTSQWTLDASGTLHIGGGTFADTEGNNPWKTYQAQIKTIVFDASVTTGN